MSALWLKLTALFCMLIDHSAYVLRFCGIIHSYRLYRVLRGVGRLAFPIFGFQLVQGAMHTKSKLKYGLRMLLFALISDLPFDLALNRSWFDPTSQNVFWTLLLGMLVVFAIQYVGTLRGIRLAAGIVLTLGLTYLLGQLAEHVLYTDYGDGGVYMIACMGIAALPMPRIRAYFAGDRLINTVVSALGILLCVHFTNTFEAFAFFSLVFIALYNGRKGYSSRFLQYGAYLFYPAHLMVLGLLFIVPRISG